MAKEKTVNYSDDMIAAIRAAAPLTFEGAQALEKEIGKSYRSIIAKAKSLGVEYVAKEAPKKRVTGAISKGEIVAAIAGAVGVDSLEGLEKATGASLAKLREALMRD